MLTRGARYTGVVEIFDDETGENVMDEVVAEGTHHRFFYDADFELTVAITDTDAEGLPLGFLFEVMAPEETPFEAALRITLDHYGRFGFKPVGRSPENDLDFSVPLSVP